MEELLSHSKDLYAMYLRKSRADLDLEAMGEGETLARHRERLYALAQRMDITPDQIVVYEEIVSGESIQDRPEMQRLLSDVYLKKYKGVLVVEVERLARGNTKDQGEVSDAFQYSGTRILTPAKVYDPHNEFDQEYFEFGLFMSRREYKTIRRRMEAGKLQSVMEGNYMLPQRTFGYNIVRPSKKDRYLVEREDESQYVRMVFDWYTEEKRSTGWIARKLTEMGVPTSRKNPEWSRNTILDMLSNMTYIGYLEWNREKIIKAYDPKTGKTRKKKVKSEPHEVIIVKGKHDGIISREQFEKAQGLLARKSPPVKLKTEVTNPLVGLLKCKDCGRALTWVNHGDVRGTRYQHKTSTLCKKKSMQTDVVMDALIVALQAYIRDYEVKIESGADQTHLLKHQQEVEAMEKELERTEKKKRRLFDSWEADDGTYTKDEFIERKLMYNKAIDGLKERIAEAKANAPAPVDYQERVVRLHQAIAALQNPEVSAKEKNVFLKSIIAQIDYDAVSLGQRSGAKAVLDVRLL